MFSDFKDTTIGFNDSQLPTNYSQLPANKLKNMCSQNTERRFTLICIIYTAKHAAGIFMYT